MKSKFNLFFVIFLCVAIALCAIFASFGYYFPQLYRQPILKHSHKNNLNPAFVFSIIKAESNFLPNATSKKGAIGLMQLMPDTAMWVAEKNDILLTKEEIYVPETNILIGCLYLKMLFEKFGCEENVLCAYNAGPANATNWLKSSEFCNNGKIVNAPFKETANYVKNVLNYQKFYNLVC